MVLNTSVPVYPDAHGPEYRPDGLTVGNIQPVTAPGAVPSWRFLPPNAGAQIMIDKTPPGRQDVFCVSAGQIVLTWPGELTAEDTEDIEAWLEIVKRKMKRIATRA